MASSLDSSLVGGHLALDMCNTVAGRGADGVPLGEKLRSYGDLLEWGKMDGLVTAQESSRLRALAAEDPGSAARVLDESIRIREALFRLFAAVAHHEPVPPDPLATFNEALADTAGRRRISAHGTRLEWRWASPDVPALGEPLWPLVQSAADLLMSVDPRRLKVCAGEGCGFLFLDQSRNRSRRWCDMADCGNRAKARRHRQRA